MAKSIRCNITIDGDTLKLIDDEVKRLHTNRSQFITDACLAKIAERQQIEVMNANPQAYRDMLLQIADGLKNK